MTQSDKEWKVVGEQRTGIVYSIGNDKKGYKFCYVDKTLYYQIQQETVKKYLKSTSHKMDEQAYEEAKDILNMLSILYPKELDDIITRIENMKKAKMLGKKNDN